jgi:hypothetical protein
MTEVEMTRLLAELSQTAKALNSESDSINGLISQYEKTLASLNIGLEVWLTSHPLDSKTRFIENPEEGEDIADGAHELELGYAKGDSSDDQWSLKLRHATYLSDGELYDVTSPRELLSASRKHRIRALELMPELLLAIKEEAEKALRTIEAAKKIVK